MKVSLLIALFCKAKNCAAQQVPVSQYFVIPVNVNPALIGSYTHPQVAFHHRSQWNSFSNNYPISTASAIYPIVQEYPRRSIKGGVGVKFSREVIGAQAWLKYTDFQIAGAYNLPLDYSQHHVLSFGVATEFVQSTINPGNLQWGSQYNPKDGYDPGIAPSVNILKYNRRYMIAEAGAVWSYNVFKNQLLSPWQWLSGIAVSNINRPDISFTDQERRAPIMLKWHTGISYTSNNWRIHPQTMLLLQEQNYHLSIGTYAQYRVGAPSQGRKPSTLLLVGLWYRWNDAVAVSGGILYQNLQFAFSADFSQHPTINYFSTGYAWEASLVYTLKRNKQVTRKRYTPLI